VFLASSNVINDDLRVVAERHRAILVALAGRKPARGLQAIRNHFSSMENELGQLLGMSGLAGGNGRRAGAESRSSRGILRSSG
jgi:hypothetical protein